MKVYIGKSNETESHYYTAKNCQGRYLGYVSWTKAFTGFTYRAFPANDNKSIGIFASKRAALGDLIRLAA